MSLASSIASIPRRPNTNRYNSIPISWSAIALVLIPLTLPIDFPLVGRLLAPEVLFLLCLPFLAGRRHLLRDPIIKAFFFLVGLWLFGAIATDVIDHTTIEDEQRGWAKIIVFGCNFAAIYLLINRNRFRFALFCVALAVGGIAKGILNPEFPGPISETWKFGIGQSVSMLALALSFGFERVKLFRIFGLIAPFILAPLHLVMNSRSLFGILSSTGGMTVVAKSRFFRRLSPVSIAFLGIVAILVGWALFSTYGSLVASGRLGEEARQKYLAETSGDLGVLLGGRSEYLVTFQAIVDAPIIGHGSWAKDWHYVNIYVAALRASGQVNIGDAYKSDLIPTHSHVFGAWVEAGILGAVFWVWVLYIGARALLSAFGSATSLPLAGYMLTSLFWDVVFSPFGLTQRLIIPAYLCCAILVIRRRI